jgi:cysteinyl-tRNA synthetase
VTLKLYNTRTRRKEEFRPIDPNNVRMYVCGPTVYDYAHIGNARPVIVFDVLFRLLRHLYGAEHVTYVRNITDVDDKINARAVELYPDMPPELAIRKLTEETAAQFHQDVAALGCLPPTHEPRATDYIAQMKEMITRLYEADIAYVAEEHVLFSVAAYGELKDVPRYGSLARRSLDEMIAGARVEVAPYKRDPMDFVLWKPSKAGEPGWPSPLNIRTPGRPGWHLECSAMSKALLGDEFDIHGGGIDLMFPHHENEVAQSCGANHTRKMANVWMHNGFLQVEGQKMSKSLGNFVTINELLQEWPGDVLRIQMLMTHYRQPINWTENNTHLACMELADWSHILQWRFTRPTSEEPSAIIEALTDDLNTPNALTALRELYLIAKKGKDKDLQTFSAACKILGFRNLDKPGLFELGVTALNVGKVNIIKYQEPVTRLRASIANNAPIETQSLLISSIEQDGLKVETRKDGTIYLHSGDRETIEKKIALLIEARKLARTSKNWPEADRIRGELAAMGIALKDEKDPATGEIVTTWEIAR